MKEFTFAIMGAGNIAHKFCDAARHVDGVKVIAIAARDGSRARAFAEKEDIPASYGGYEAMLKAEKPDAVYIATLPNTHFPLSMLCLDYKVPVICEKAMFMNAQEAETVFARSEKEGVFVMEAMWSRFLPAVTLAKKWLEEGRIGKLVYADTAIGFLAPPEPDNRYRDPALGGGAARDITVYTYEITTHVLGDGYLSVETAMVKDPIAGADLSDQVTLTYPDFIATMFTTFGAAVEERMLLVGEKGKMILPSPHHKNQVFLYDAEGNPVDEFKGDPALNGFVYEIGEVAKCVREGKCESPVVPHKTTIACAKLFDEILK